jgi:hypothetical protein
VLWSRGRLVLPTSAHLDHPEIDWGEGVEILADPVVTLSGSFVILPGSNDLPVFLKRKLEEALSEGLAVSVGIAAGDYELCYEIYESLRHEFSSHTRQFYNVVLRPLTEAV